MFNYDTSVVFNYDTLSGGFNLKTGEGISFETSEDFVTARSQPEEDVLQHHLDILRKRPVSNFCENIEYIWISD